MSTAKKASARTGVSRESEELAEQVEALRADLSKLAESVKGLTKSGLSQAESVARDKVGEVKDVAEASMAELEAAVRRKPLQSALIAVGLGFLFGLIARR